MPEAGDQNLKDVTPVGEIINRPEDAETETQRIERYKQILENLKRALNIFS